MSRQYSHKQTISCSHSRTTVAVHGLGFLPVVTTENPLPRYGFCMVTNCRSNWKILNKLAVSIDGNGD